MKALTLMMLIYLMVGCALVTVEVAQKQIVDIGDGTADNYRSKDIKDESITPNLNLKEN